MTGVSGPAGRLRGHWLFTAAFLLGLVLRVVTMAGFPPAIWFGGDSASYLSTALRLAPGTSRLSGYGIMLRVLEPFHSFAVVTAVQHVMGLAMAAMSYALLRRYDSASGSLRSTAVKRNPRREFPLSNSFVVRATA